MPLRLQALVARLCLFVCVSLPPQEVVVTAADLLGAPEAPTGGGMSLGSLFQRQASPGSGGGGGAGASRAEVYALKDRAGVLAQLEAPPVVLHVAESEHKKFTFEASVGASAVWEACPGLAPFVLQGSAWAGCAARYQH